MFLGNFSSQDHQGISQILNDNRQIYIIDIFKKLFLSANCPFYALKIVQYDSLSSAHYSRPGLPLIQLNITAFVLYRQPSRP